MLQAETSFSDRPPTASRLACLIRVQTSPIHGYGVFAAAPISKDTCIIEYEGKRITHEEANIRAEKSSADPFHTFFFGLSNGTIIDGGDDGADARWINHSCDPNCEAREANDRVFIFALRDIESGEELHYSYRIDLTDEQTASLKKAYECRCGAGNCLKTMLGDGPPISVKRFTILSDQDDVILKLRDATGSAAALAMVLTFQHGIATQEQDVVDYFAQQLAYQADWSKRISFLTMKHFVETRQLAGTAYGQLRLQQLIDLAPAIIQINLNDPSHYTVFRGLIEQHAILADPVYGNIAMPLETFLLHWHNQNAFVVSATT